MVNKTSDQAGKTKTSSSSLVEHLIASPILWCLQGYKETIPKLRDKSVNKDLEILQTKTLLQNSMSRTLRNGIKAHPSKFVPVIVWYQTREGQPSQPTRALLIFKKDLSPNSFSGVPEAKQNRLDIAHKKPTERQGHWSH
ncbi:hypothetical protein M9H77_18276 [Catharanthus roseus]|uniref:Uncharacterized protein n=1 Tax=Catharanthus roseus TaxID=4058 RepID=A0ACC0B7A8_CATRO|nr:hypothetical protein M9H77_18276 [Catharanthus roseus]